MRPAYPPRRRSLLADMTKVIVEDAAACLGVKLKVVRNHRFGNVEVCVRADSAPARWAMLHGNRLGLYVMASRVGYDFQSFVVIGRFAGWN